MVLLVSGVLGVGVGKAWMDQLMGPRGTEARLHCTVGGHSPFEFWSQGAEGSRCHGRAWNPYFVDRLENPALSVWPHRHGWGGAAQLFLSALRCASVSIFQTLLVNRINVCFAI